jgi:hypothetical protein
MSLHALATDMASKGRNGDSMLVHMTPGEVHGLQALAMKHGGSLTVNPDTGLPEANFLKSLLPMLAGFALGPAGFGLVSSAMGAGALVGGITGIATGSLSKGLMAGLGAYGGFGIGESLAGLGASEMSAGKIASAMPEYTGNAVEYADKVNALRAETLASANAPGAIPAMDKVSAGFSSATASPMDALNFAKDNKMVLGAAAAPIMADMMVPTTTKASTPMAPGRIREKRWDGRQFVDVASTDANVYNTSGRSFSDLYRGYNNGGIVALADGGVPGYAAGGYKPTDTEIFDYFKTPGLTDTKIAQDMQTFGVSAADIARITGTQGQQADYEKRFAQAVATPASTAQEFLGATSDVGLQNQALADALKGSGLSAAAQYASTHTDIGMPENVSETYGGLKGLSSNINYGANQLLSQIGAGSLTGQAARQQALTEMNKYGMNEADVVRATGKTLAELFPDTVVKPPVVVPPVVPPVVTSPAATIKSGYHLDDNGVLVPNISATQNTTTNVASPTDLYTAPATSLPVGVSGNTGPSQIGGGATVNPNGTITTSPRIPGIPVGGFTGSQNLRDTYTKGGGSLGYTSPTFKTIEDFNAKYLERISGDSRAAYDYLTGKGGAKYPVKSGVGRISEAYDEAVLGYPTRGNLPYIYNKATGKMDANPDYVAPGRDSAGNVTYSMSLNDIKSSLKDAPLSGQALYEWAKSNNLTAQQIADATGRPLSSVYSDFRAGSKAAADKATDAAKGGDTIQVTDSSGYNTETVTATKQADGTYLGGNGKKYDASGKEIAASGGIMGYAMGGMSYADGGLGTLGSYSDGGRLLKGPGDGVSDSIPATIGRKQQPARLADGEFVVPARIVSELGNGSTDAGAKKLYAMMDRVQRARGKTTGKNKVAANSRADKYLPA